MPLIAVRFFRGVAITLWEIEKGGCEKKKEKLSCDRCDRMVYTDAMRTRPVIAACTRNEAVLVEKLLPSTNFEGTKIAKEGKNVRRKRGRAGYV